MKKIFSFLLLASLVMVACESEPTQNNKPTIAITSSDVVTLGAEGGEVEILFTTTDGNYTNVKVSENAAWISTEVTDSKVVVAAKANDSADAREAVITLKYYNSSASVTVKQEGSSYDVVFTANRFEGIYFGTDFSAVPNYYIILSDIGAKSDGSPKANGTYYFFDMYSKVKGDENAPILPAGTYHFDATNSYADLTFTDESSWYAVMDEAGKYAKSAEIKDATINVSNNKFEAVIEFTNGERHFVKFEGKLLVAINYILSTFTEDVEFNVEGASVNATCHGDSYEFGQQTWFIEMVKGNDYFSFELLSPSNSSFDGIYQALPAGNVVDYSNKFIPGLLGEGLIGTWYAKLTNNTIKGDVMAPMVEGMLQVITDGDAVTVNLSCKDDAGNNITGSVAGNIAK